MRRALAYFSLCLCFFSAQAEIQDYGTAISTVMSDSNEPSAVYSVDGRKLQTSQRGLNIIRMSDGTVKKVLVK